MHFVEGHRLNDSARLARTAEEHAGVPRAETEAFLKSKEGLAEITAALARAGELGVQSIPKFIVGGAYVLDGAVHARDHVALFREIETAPDGPGVGMEDEDGQPVGWTASVFASVLGVPAEVLREPSHPAVVST
mmetsp:Transcript_17582/g.58939  ORF Transcript_17582/g.58939 Transcript_17582/m.58939 type:complete len:134 (+) Transcript_17582:537-938(+)